MSTEREELNIDDFVHEAEMVYKREAEAIRLKWLEEEKEGKAPRGMKEFLADPEEQKKARRLGKQISELTRGKWFTMKEYMRVSGRGESEASVQTAILQQFGHLIGRKRASSGGVFEMKVVFDTIEEQKLIEDEIKGYELQINILRNNLEALKKKQKNIDQSQKDS